MSKIDFGPVKSMESGCIEIELFNSKPSANISSDVNLTTTFF